MKQKLLFVVLIVSLLLMTSCNTTEKTETGEGGETEEKDDFGCWPPSCSFIQDPNGKQMCEDWKAGKSIVWPDCSVYANYPNCITLCESEKKNNPQTSQNVSNNNSQEGDADQNQEQPEIPTGVPASDPESGSVYIYIDDQASCESQCDKFSHIDSRVIRIDDMTGKNWVSFGTFGNGTDQLHDPSHLAVGPDGKLYIVDSKNNRIVRIDDMTGKGWTTYDIKDEFGEPLGIAFDSKGRIYIAASGQIIRIDDITGKGKITFGTSGSGVNQFYKLKDIALDSMDRIYGADAGNNRIIRIDDMNGKGWVTYGTKGSGVGQFEDESNGGVLDSEGRIYIADEHNNRIVRIDDMNGKGWVEFNGLSNDTLKEPHDITIMKNGHIYILDTYNHRVVRIDDMTGNGWIAFAPDAKTEDPRNYHKWHMEAPHGMFVMEK